MDTVFGLPVTPCEELADHDWHSNGLRFCPGIPAITEPPAEDIALEAGFGWVPGRSY